MHHLGTKTLETDRLILRPYASADAPHMFKNWANDPEVTKFLTWQPHASEADSLEYIHSIDYADPTVYSWGIELKALGQVVGGISMVHADDKVEMVHVGYCIGPNWWHTGIMSEAFAAVIRFFFEEVGVNRIEARHDTNNPNSGKVMQKCGLIYEGTHRRSDLNNQGINDSAWYAILREDYLK